MAESRRQKGKRSLDPQALVPRIHEASLEPEAWPEVLAAVAEAVGGVAPALFVVDADDPAATFHVCRQVDPSWLAAYEAHFQGLDLRRRAMEVRPEGTVITGSQLVPEERLLRSEFYQDFLRPQGFHHIALVMAYKRDGRMGVMRVLRKRGAEPFGARELAFLRELQPHLHTAVAVQLELAMAREQARTLQETLANIAVGYIGVDARGRLLYANQVAERLLAAQDGLVLRRRQVQAEREEDSAALQRLLDAASRTGGDSARGLRIRRSSGVADLSIRVVSISRAGAVYGVPLATAIIFIRDPTESGRVTESSLRELFRLTKAEARVARRLVDGRRSPDIAKELGVSPETVRSHRKQIFAKVDVHSQPELIQRVMAYHAPLSSGSRG